MMRVISQDGTIDVPYDSSLFMVVVSMTVYRIKAEFHGQSVIMAEYKTQEEALSEIRMMRKRYCELIYNIHTPMLLQLHLSDSIYQFSTMSTAN